MLDGTDAQTRQRATFDRPADEASSISPTRVGLRYVLEFLADGETPGRVLNDHAVRDYMPFIEGPGTIVEIGAATDYYKHFAKAGQKYELTNFDGECDRIVDATNMPYETDSVDAFMSMFVLEHIYDVHSVIEESYRCLKPGGRMLIGVPFLYYYHGAPDDYFRFTHSAMNNLLSKFKIIKGVSFGNRALVVSQFYHEKPVLGSTRSWLGRAAIRVMIAPVLAVGLMGNQNDPIYAVKQLYLCEKS